MPELPTISEAGLSGYESTQWSGLLAPASTPPHVVNRLHQEMVAVLQMTDIQASAKKLDSDIVASIPAEFSAYMRSEMEKWAKVAASAGLKPE